MRKRKAGIVFIFSLVLFVFCVGTRIADASESGETETSVQTSTEIQEQIRQSVMAEFDFDEIEDSLRDMFPKERISFGDMIEMLISGNPEEAGKTILHFLKDQFAYDVLYNRKNLIYVILAALTAAVFSNYADAFRNRQISDISFYVIYILLITLCLTSFRMSVSGLEERLETLMNFMQVLCPTYFMAVAFASGSTTALFFYNVVLFLIYAVEVLIVRIILPIVNIYMIVRILGNLTEEDFMSELAELIHKAVVWGLRSLLGMVVGINVIQGLLAPAIDTVKRSTLTRTAEAVPWVGDFMGGTAEVLVGTAVLIKNGIGMAGAVIAVVICAVPVLQMLITALMYKFAAALVQPVSDRRITSCISGVSEGYELLFQVLFTTAILFLLTLAITAAFTT